MQLDSIEERTATEGLLLELSLWDKPAEIKEFKTTLVGLYNQLLNIAKLEKQARETFVKNQQHIFTKVGELRKQIVDNSEKKNQNCKFVVIENYLRIYKEVLRKSVEKFEKDAEFIEVNVIDQLNKVLKEDKHISDSIQTSIDHMSKYHKEKRQVEAYKKACRESYANFEDTVLIEDIASRISSAYSGEPYSNKINESRHPYQSRLYDYTEGIRLFNVEAKNHLQTSTQHLKKCSRYFQDLSIAAKKSIDASIKFYLNQFPENQEWKQETEEVLAQLLTLGTAQAGPDARNWLMDPEHYGLRLAENHSARKRENAEFLF
jgi:hypothetical protein